MKFSLSRAAEADLINIYLHGVQEFGAQQAEAYQDKIDHTIELIADTPEIARLRREITPPVRVHPVEMHMIFYLIDGELVRILRVRHSRENWTAHPTE